MLSFMIPIPVYISEYITYKSYIHKKMYTTNRNLFNEMTIYHDYYHFDQIFRYYLYN